MALVAKSFYATLIAVSLLHAANAAVPILLTELGIETTVSSPQDSKALGPILKSPSGNTNAGDAAIGTECWGCSNWHCLKSLCSNTL